MTNEEELEQDITPEETQNDDEIELEEEIVEDDQPSVEDLQKQLKTALAQKEHFRKKSQEKKETKEEINKTNTPTTITRQEAILFAKGYTEEEVDLANKISGINGVSLLEAIEDEYVKTKVDSRRQKEKSEKASLNTSSGNAPVKADKPVGDMTREEHEKYFRKVMGGV